MLFATFDFTCFIEGDEENDEESVVGKVVEYNDGKKWQPGRIVSTKNRDEGKLIKIKFDHHHQVTNDDFMFKICEFGFWLSYLFQLYICVL